MNVTAANISVSGVLRSPVLIGLLLELITLSACLYIFAALAVLLIRSLRSRKKRVQRNIRTLLLTLLVSFGLTTFARSLMGVIFFAMHRNDGNCHTVDTVHQVLHAVGGSLVGIFLWTRQYTLYRHRMFRRMSNKCVLRLNYSLLATMVALSVIALGAVNFTAPEDAVAEVEQLCIYVGETDFVHYVASAYQAVGVLIQVAILALFVYMLRQHQQLARQVATTSGNRPALKRLRAIVRKCFYCAAVCAATDLACALLTTLLIEAGITLLVTNAIWNVDALINFICLLVCFNDWRRMLNPCCSGRSVDVATPQPSLFVVGHSGRPNTPGVSSVE